MLRLLVFLILSLVWGQAKAQGTDTVAFSADLQDLIITGQYAPTHHKNVIHRVSIIDLKTIKKRGALTLDKAISISPAVRLNEDPILGTSVKMRGIGASNVAILIDGVPVIGRQNGAIDLSQISMQNVERIEIVEGPLSNIYGSNAAAGVINVITKKSQVKKFRFNSDHQVESIGIHNHQGTIGYKWKKLGVSLSGRFLEYDQFPSDSLRLFEDGSPKFPFNPKVQKSLASQLRYDFNEEHNLVLKYDHNDELVDDFGVVKRRQFKPYATDLTYWTRRNDLAAIYTGKPGEHVFLDMTAAYNRYDRVRSEERLLLETQEVDSLLGFADTTYFNTLFSRLNVAYVPGGKWSFMGGITYNDERGGGDRIISDTARDSSEARIQEGALYSEVKYNVMAGLQVAISGRWIQHSIYDNRLTSSLQLKYDFHENWSVKGGYAQGYRSPSLKELYLEFVDVNHNIVGNPELEPEISHDVQATIMYDAERPLSGSFNMYGTRINNRINLTETETLGFRYDNIDSYRVFGFQPSLAYDRSGFMLSSSVSFGFWSTSVNAKDIPAFGRVIDVNNTLSYEEPYSAVAILFNHRHVGSQPLYRLEDGETVVSRIAAYDMMDLSLSRSFWKERINLVIGSRNLLNVRNTNISNGGSTGAHSSSRANVVSQGRSWFAQVGLSF